MIVVIHGADHASSTKNMWVGCLLGGYISRLLFKCHIYPPELVGVIIAYQWSGNLFIIHLTNSPYYFSTQK